MSVPKTLPNVSEDALADDKHAPRPVSFAENLVLTVKVLAVLGLIGAAVWAANLWATAR